MTLQRRVLRYLALAAIASCTLTVGVAVILVRHKIAAQRVTALESKADLLALDTLGPGTRVYSAGTGAARRVGPRVRRAILAAIPATGDGEGTITVDGRSLLYVSRTGLEGRVVLFGGARLAFGEWRPFLWSLVVAGLGGALLAVLLSVLLARRLTRPIGELAGATRRLAGGEPGVAVPVSGSDELAELGRSFNAMSAELERARESQRSFLESVSHELKTPLTSIRGYAEALEESAVPAAEGGRIIAGEADRLERLVFDLLDLARLGRAGFVTERRPVDLTAAAAAVVRRHLPRARELGVHLLSEGSDEAWGLADEGRLLQAASNLVENALRLTPAGGSVTVAATPGAIEVSDTGPGLTPEDLPRAFERFYLHDRYRSERAVGSGLGLAIVKELAESMGGSVQARTRPGSHDGGPGGAKFTIRLAPSAAPQAATARWDR